MYGQYQNEYCLTERTLPELIELNAFKRAGHTYQSFARDKTNLLTNLQHTRRMSIVKLSHPVTEATRLVG